MRSRWQPTLYGTRIRLRPLEEGDFEPLFEVASDPLIWAGHPEPDRCKRERFRVFFDSGMACGGALIALEQGTERILGSSRFTRFESGPEGSSLEIGYTFLARHAWGGAHNLEMKSLMLHHAFQEVETALFYVGDRNLRSQKAMEKLGASRSGQASSAQLDGSLRVSLIYRIERELWRANLLSELPRFAQPALETPRLALEPIEVQHASELWELFGDPELHRFVPFEAGDLEKQKERCARWARRRSPDGRELWLNWAARERSSGRVIAHLQAGVRSDGTASIGYLVARSHQRQGFAYEALEAVLTYLRDDLRVSEVRASSDTRNQASHRLARKLGMTQIDLVRNADFFKGAPSDEIVFSLPFKSTSRR